MYIGGYSNGYLVVWIELDGEKVIYMVDIFLIFVY